MKLFKKIAAFFGIKQSNQEIEIRVLNDNLHFDIDNLRKLNTLERVIEVHYTLNKKQIDKMPLSNEVQQSYCVLTYVVCIIQALESIGMLEEVSIEDLLIHHPNDRHGIVSALIEIDYWDRIKDISDRKTLMKIFEVNSGDDSLSKVIKRLKSDIDNIKEIELLEDYIKDCKKITDVYSYGAIKLFSMYKYHLRDINDSCDYELIQRIKDNIDLKIVPSLELDIYQLKEKLEGENFLNRIGDINILEDIVVLRDENSPTYTVGVCQVKINSIVKVELIDNEIGDDRLTKLYYPTTNLDDKKKILLRIKSNYGFVYQESINLEIEFLESQKREIEYLLNRKGYKPYYDPVYYDITSPSLGELTEKSKVLLIDSIIALCDGAVDVFDFCHTVFLRCNSNYKITDIVCRNIKITGTINRLAVQTVSKDQLIKSLFIVGNCCYASIIERFYQLEPNLTEMCELGSNMVALNNDDAELCYVKELMEYVARTNLSANELKLMHDEFEYSALYEPLRVLIIKKMITHNPQLV